MATRKKPTIIKARKPEPTPPPVPEAFIGHESATMMAEETFEEFEARMQHEAPPSEEVGTNTAPVLDVEPDDETELPEEPPEPETAASADEDDYLPPEA